MDPRERRRLKTAAESLLKWLEGVPDARSCETCEHWERGRCRLANAVPPAEVQAVGCEMWKFDGVPF